MTQVLETSIKAVVEPLIMESFKPLRAELADVGREIDKLRTMQQTEYTKTNARLDQLHKEISNTRFGLECLRKEVFNSDELAIKDRAAVSYELDCVHKDVAGLGSQLSSMQKELFAPSTQQLAFKQVKRDRRTRRVYTTYDCPR
ncbi:hypothetical protein BASA81_000144 [Batrachochytrium salamandrivorans]|nr:hypothetical protein BASA81_000144 [Batrachochytrium salamandrivorans]